MGEALKECKGRAAARSLAAMILDPMINIFLLRNAPTAFEQACKSLEPFGYPDEMALREKLTL